MVYSRESNRIPEQPVPPIPGKRNEASTPTQPARRQSPSPSYSQEEGQGSGTLSGQRISGQRISGQRISQRARSQSASYTQSPGVTQRTTKRWRGSLRAKILLPRVETGPPAAKEV
ncbi:hypothetical protein ACOMHN_012033 [Nucella lapillus]